MKNSKDGMPVRQNSAYTPSRKHEVNLRRNPTLHFQIGLILALLAAIFFVEMRMPEKAMTIPDIEVNAEDVFTVGEVRPEPKKKVLVKKEIIPAKQSKSEILDNIEKTKNESTLVETLFITTDTGPDEPLIDPTTPIYDDYEDIAPVPVILVEQVPLFPGCEGLDTNDARRACMSSKISKFVSRKFRTDKGEGLGLKGENQIFVVFTIDKKGNVVEVQAKAPHEKLKEEAIRVTELLPSMTPGKQQGRTVNVKMALPIRFIIED